VILGHWKQLGRYKGVDSSRHGREDRLDVVYNGDKWYKSIGLGLKMDPITKLRNNQH